MRGTLVILITLINVGVFVLFTLLIYASHPLAYINIDIVNVDQDQRRRQYETHEPIWDNMTDSEQCACSQPGIKVFNLGREYVYGLRFLLNLITNRLITRYISSHYCPNKVMKAGSVTLTRVLRKFGCRTLHHGLHTLRGQDPYINVTRWRNATMKDRRSTNKQNTKHIIPRVMMLAEKNGHPLLHYFEDDVEFITLSMSCNRSTIYWIFVTVCNPSINFRSMDFPNWMTLQSIDLCMFIMLILL